MAAVKVFECALQPMLAVALLVASSSLFLNMVIAIALQLGGLKRRRVFDIDAADESTVVRGLRLALAVTRTLTLTWTVTLTIYFFLLYGAAEFEDERSEAHCSRALFVAAATYVFPFLFTALRYVICLRTGMFP